MTSNPLADVVSGQYERWMYPQPILDLRGWLANNLNAANIIKLRYCCAVCHLLTGIKLAYHASSIRR